jgi:acetylornithine/N-succinyldiaminopimelate aminotransferase
VRGEHCHLIGEDGRRYLDFASGIAVNILGHSHGGLVGAIQKQAATLMHVSNLYGSPQGEHLAQRLIDLTFADTVFFTNSGAEAVECAIKTARAYHQHVGNDHKFELITFKEAFHGRTLGTISASNQEKMHKGFLPLLPGFKYVDFGDLEAAKAAIGPNTAGFLVEPIQGEGGIKVPPEEFLPGLRALCDEHDLVLVLDEVQSGVARTGTFYAYEQLGVEPDILPRPRGSAAASRWEPASLRKRRRVAWLRARMVRPMAAIRWPWRRRKRCWMPWPMTNFWPMCAIWVRRSQPGWSSSSETIRSCSRGCAGAACWGSN